MLALISMKKMTNPKTGLTSTYNHGIHCCHSLTAFNLMILRRFPRFSTEH
jgi:hypothetical protein